jgi:deoxyhypusine synthase
MGENPSFKREVKSDDIRANATEQVKGFTITPGIKLSELGDLYKTIGFQATHLGQAIEILRKIKSENVPLFMSATSNMGSSGVREIIAQVMKEKKIVALMTTTGLIEEDIMKTKTPFFLGSFDVDDAEVKANGLNRIGNIYVPDENYAEFEKFHMEFIKEMHEKHKIMSPSEYIKELGLRLNDENSILYWAAKNDIPIYAPGFVDGAIGDHFFFYNQNKEDTFIIDTTKDVTKFYKQLIAPEKTACLCLGSGIAKHHLIGAALLRPEGLDYAIYLQTGTPFDGSLSGAKPSEAVSWNKVSKVQNSAAVEADATITFPILAAELLN